MDKLNQYADMLIEVGIGLLPKQNLLIYCDAAHAFFARLVMERAYAAGAGDVSILWQGEQQNNEYRGYRMLWIYAVDPTLSPVDEPSPPPLPWTLACLPPVNTKLSWDEFYRACRLDNDNPTEHWKEHIKNLEQRADFLNKQNFRYIKFNNSLGTDITIELPKDHVWITCLVKDKSNSFIANIPTEEVFTAPLKTGANGIVYATMPMVYMGELVDGFWLRFENGKVVEYDAKRGKGLLDHIFNNHEGAKYLGELALVPHTSPLSQINKIWFESSFDENVSSHLALGYAYPHCSKGGEGLNQSSIHLDFMIGSACTEVFGIDDNKTCTKL